MTLAQSIAARTHKVSVQVYIDGSPVKVLRGSYDYGFDSVSGAVSVTLQQLYPWVQFAREIRLYLGWDGFTQQVAKALLVNKSPSWWPLSNEVRGVGYLHRAQKPYSAEVVYWEQTDTAIVDDLLARSNVPQRDIQGAGVTLATVKEMVLQDGDSPWSFIEAIDAITGYRTFESPPDGTVRRRQITLGVPAAGYAFSYEEGVNETSIRRTQTIEQLYNRVRVEGLAGEYIETTRRSDSPYVDRDYTYKLSSDWVQTQEICDEAARIIMLEKNRVVDVLEITTPGDPRVQPGMTVRVKNPSIGITNWTNYWVRHVHGAFDGKSYWLTLTVEGGTGEGGYVEPRPPVAVFAYTVTKEKFEVGGTPTVMYTVMCDASESWDPDSDPATLSFAWSNNKNADTGSAIKYATGFTEAEMAEATKPSITLTVTDPDGKTDALTMEIDAAVESVTLRELYVAASGQAEATPDGGVTWHTNAISAVSTPEIAAEGLSYYGCTDGKLYASEDYLATAPTLVHTFGDQVNCIWINEMDANRVVVGLDNGEIWATADASKGVAATWTKLYTFAHAVNWIAESPYQQGQYWACVDEAVWLTFDSFATAPAWHFGWGSGDVARKIALSPFANYGCGTVASGSPVKRSDGVEITGLSGTDCRAICHHIRDDILYAAELSGSDALVYAKLPGTTVFTLLATIAGAGQPHALIRDGDHEMILYMACAEGLYKTYDGGAHWWRVRDYSAAGLDGLQVGYGSAPWPAIPVPAPADLFVYDGRIMAITELSPTGYEFRDGGLPGGYTCSALTSDVGNRDIMYASINGNLLYKSVDAGVNWSLIKTWSGNVTRLAANTSVPGELWAGIGKNGTDFGIQKSTDYGANWTRKFEPTGPWPVGAGNGEDICADGQSVWAITTDGLWTRPDLHVSADGGATWPINYVSWGVLVAMRRSLLDSNRGIITSSNTAYPLKRSTIDNWANYFDPAALSCALAAYSPNGDYLLSLDNVLYRSTDDGATQTQVHASSGRCIAFARNNNVVYIGADMGYLLYSTDAGLAWDSVQLDRAQTISIVHVAEESTAANIFRSDTSWKALSLWNGAGNDAPPDGWRNIAYDDSAWGAAVQDTAPGNPIIAGTQAIWPSVPPADNTEQCCLRKTFTGPSGVVSLATIQVNADDVADVWINNVFIGRASGAGTTHTFNVPPAAILPGATNAIAVLAANTTGRAWVSAKLEVS